jgi:membrane-bound metal-dependent hydrolase YbcI (DUF457 family)
VPSPVGHALGGVAAAWMADLVPGDRAWRRDAPGEHSWHARIGGRTTAACAVLGALPDIDLLLGGHRTYSHSVTAVVVVGLVAALVAVRTRRPVARLALMCAGAYGSHLLLDWLAVDSFAPRGLQLLWPFSHTWFISGWDLFGPTARQHIFSAAALATNVRAVVREAALLAPVLLALWGIRVKALAGLPPELAGRHHPAEQGTGPVLRVAQPVVEHVENREAYVEPDEIGER